MKIWAIDYSCTKIKFEIDFININYRCNIIYDSIIRYNNILKKILISNLQYNSELKTLRICIIK